MYSQLENSGNRTRGTLIKTLYSVAGTCNKPSMKYSNSGGCRALCEFFCPVNRGYARGTTLYETLFRIFLIEKNDNAEPDVISNVTSPWMWGILLGVTIALAAVIYWGFCGTLVDSVAGTGVVVRTHGITAITAKTSGSIEYLDIKPGSVIFPNQILGRIYNPECFSTSINCKSNNGNCRKDPGKFKTASTHSSPNGRRATRREMNLSHSSSL